MADVEEILTFWFEGDPGLKREKWFQGGPAFDAECRRFLPDWEAARAGERDSWLEAPGSLLAYVLLTDQFPRNLFREDGRAYATDDRALAAARHAVAAGWDDDMGLHERAFLYLPFEHAEDQAAQAESVRLYAGLGDAEYLKYAEVHRDIVQEFGRFPHRNAVLGRASTPAEDAFLKEKGRGF